jgi:cold shock CspA family protein
MPRVSGTVKFFSHLKGYGFVTPDDGSPEVFVHRTNLVQPLNRLQDDDRVAFEIVDSPPDRFGQIKGTGKKAVKVELI